MKKSDLMLLRKNILKATTPPPLPTKKKEDVSDELSKLFDDGTELTGTTTSAAPTSPSRPDSQPDSGSQSEKRIPARQNDSQPDSGSQSYSDSQPHNLLAGVTSVQGFLRIPNTIVDNVLRLLDTDEQAVYVQLYRLSWGHNKPRCFISLPKLSERTNIKMTSLKAALKRLEGRGLLVKSNLTLGYGKQQGIEYSVSSPDRQSDSDSQPPRGSQSPADTIKVNTQKENTQTQSDVVRVGSKFTIEECRKYAKHLQTTGQGINNPGGYATTINRTGEADEAIAAYLSPLNDAPVVDVSGCPDCNGTGFWYPNGIEKGVAKCRHENLLT